MPPRLLRVLLVSATALHLCASTLAATETTAPGTAPIQTVRLDGSAGGPRFDGIGLVNGGGATAVLLKDYPEPQRSQILDLVFNPKFGASVSTLLVEIPGDGNSTQGSMPSHRRTRDDLDFSRGYTWWLLHEAKRRNPALSLDAAAWSAPGWIGEDAATRFPREHANGDTAFWSPDAADYYVSWLRGLRTVHGLELDALGCRNEKGVSLEFAKTLRAALDANGFASVRIHAFDNWPDDKFDFLKALDSDPAARDAIAIVGAHVLYAKTHASADMQALAARLGKPIWNTEDHVYRKGFACLIGIVEAFNDSFIRSGATKTVNWYDIAGVYPLEPYSEDPATILAHQPWSGHYEVREALWGYAHYGQFTQVGWRYLKDACGPLDGGGSLVALASPNGDYSVVVETAGATAAQTLRLQLGGGLSPRPLCVWRSDAREQFVRLGDIRPQDGALTLTLVPDTVYSLSTTTGQQKGAFAAIPDAQPFPFPYHENFDEYAEPAAWGRLPRYFADIEEVFELVARPDGPGRCLRQAIATRPIAWAPEWQPYTILGDEAWTDYEVGVDVWLNPGDSAGVMGRINHVGTGYGCIPKGYFLQLASDGVCRLVVVRGKPDKKKLVGDAEQQRLLAASKDAGEGGEEILAETRLPESAIGAWHNLKLRFAGDRIVGLVDDRPVLSATDSLYARGMAGLLAGAREGRALSTPFYDNLVIKTTGTATPAPADLPANVSPLYQP